MKLTNQQIEAIVSQVSRKNSDEVCKENKAIREDPKVLAEAKKYLSIIEKIPEKVRKSMYGLNGLKIDSFIDSIIASKELEPKTKLIGYQKLRDSIIIASIDSKDLEELKSKLNIEI